MKAKGRCMFLYLRLSNIVCEIKAYTQQFSNLFGLKKSVKGMGNTLNISKFLPITVHMFIWHFFGTTQLGSGLSIWYYGWVILQDAVDINVYAYPWSESQEMWFTPKLNIVFLTLNFHYKWKYSWCWNTLAAALHRTVTNYNFIHTVTGNVIEMEHCTV